MHYSEEKLQQLDKQITEYCDKEQIFGVLRITIKDRIVFQKSMGYANMDKKIPFTERSMFTLYSLSKPFCVMGLMKLKEKGLVDLDRHPGVYVPEARCFDSRVTIRHMLHHVSGLPDFFKTEEFVRTHPTGYAHQLREQLPELAKYPQLFAPGTETEYANINMLLCALIIENISGVSYPQYMKNEVFDQLGMKTAVVDREDLFIENRVRGYALSDGRVVETEKNCNWSLGGGDIVGTVEDVYGLNRAIKKKLLLQEDTWNEVLTPHPINSFGCGCTVINWHGKKCIKHNGGHLGFRTLHRQLPEDDFDVIFLSNSGYGNARKILSEMVYEAFYGEDASVPCAEEPEMDKGYIS